MIERQKKFAEFYAMSGNAADAARRAGYSEKTARSQGQRLLTNADISQYVRELQDKAASDRIANLEEVKAVWTEALRDSNEKTSNRLKAGELLARSAGEFIKTDQSHGVVRGGDNNIFSEENAAESVVICLPWDGKQIITATENDEGKITPLPGAEGDDVLIYLPRKSVKSYFEGEKNG